MSFRDDLREELRFASLGPGVNNKTSAICGIAQRVHERHLLKARVRASIPETHVIHDFSQLLESDKAKKLYHMQLLPLRDECYNPFIYVADRSGVVVSQDKLDKIDEPVHQVPLVMLGHHTVITALDRAVQRDAIGRAVRAGIEALAKVFDHCADNELIGYGVATQALLSSRSLTTGTELTFLIHTFSERAEAADEVAEELGFEPFVRGDTFWRGAAPEWPEELPI